MLADKLTQMLYFSHHSLIDNITIITMCIVNISHMDMIEPSNSTPPCLSSVVSLMSSEAQVHMTSGQWTVRIVAYCGTWRYIMKHI